MLESYHWLSQKVSNQNQFFSHFCIASYHSSMNAFVFIVYRFHEIQTKKALNWPLKHQSFRLIWKLIIDLFTQGNENGLIFERNISLLSEMTFHRIEFLYNNTCTICFVYYVKTVKLIASPNVTSLQLKSLTFV